MQDNRINGAGGGGGVRAEDVISKLKDDGDFDRLRRKIIRRLKENEELRSNIISLVKQSAALDRPGVENMKPRQLSDAIHQEIGEKLMSQVSDGLWNIIRSADGMKTEITETVQSIYDKLVNPHGKENGESSSLMDSPSIQNKHEDNRNATKANEIDGDPSDGEPNEPPGFGSTGLDQGNKIEMSTPTNGQVIERNKRKKVNLDLPESENLDAPPGYSSVLKHKNLDDASDEDPDVPPGFG